VGPLLLLAGVSLALAQLFRASIPWPVAYRALFEEMAFRYGVDENLLHALAWHESDFNPNAIGAKNTNGTQDFGLFQINTANWPALGITGSNWKDPRESTRAAAMLLHSIASAHPGLSIMDTISVYNAGGSKVAGRVGGAKQQNDADGGFINPTYVADVYGKYLMVAGAALAPVR